MRLMANWKRSTFLLVTIKSNILSVNKKNRDVTPK